MIHGYTSESSWLLELNAVAMVKAGFFVCSLDLQGHGYSEGSPGYIPCIQPLVQDCIQYFDSARADHLKLPAFLYGESLGGAIATLICLRQKNCVEWFDVKWTDVWSVKEIQTCLPTGEATSVGCLHSTIMEDCDHQTASIYIIQGGVEEKDITKSPNRVASEKPPAAIALELLKVYEYIQGNSHELQVPLLIHQGGENKVCDPEAAKVVYKSSGSKDKT